MKEDCSPFPQHLEMDEIKEHLAAFCNICKGGPEAGPIGKLDMGSRFRWLTATRSTVLQCSRVHPGLSADPAFTLKSLHATSCGWRIKSVPGFI